MPIDSSKFFDSIRIKPNKVSAKAQARANEESAMCEWAGCPSRGPHRAPKGRENARQYFHFCLNHVREYNQSYNFFSGMNAEAVARYQKDALTGHRPTWKMGANGGKKGAAETELSPLMEEVLEALDQKKITRCVASSSPKERVLLSLSLTNQLKYFDRDA